MVELFTFLKENKKSIVTAESITGGLISSYLTSFPGASKVYWGGFITYTEESKKHLLNINSESLELYGAVSSVVATEMALGALENSTANYSLAITGYAGPKTYDDKKKVGTVYIALTSKNRNSVCNEFCFSGNRDNIRKQALSQSLLELNKFILNG